MKTLATLSLLLFSVIFTSCDETKKVIDVAGSIQLTGSYTVSAIDGNTLVKTTNPTFTMSALDNSFRGNTGCNSAFGNYTIEQFIIDFSDLAVSERYCSEEKIMETERNFLNALNKAGSYSLQNEVLTLYSKTDKSILLLATKDAKTKE